jgi:hypothetical protein
LVGVRDIGLLLIHGMILGETKELSKLLLENAELMKNVLQDKFDLYILNLFKYLLTN